MADHAISARPGQALDANFEPHLYRIRDLIHLAAGIYHPDNKLYYVDERCRRRMRATGISSLAEYLQVLTLGLQREPEMRHLLNEIAIGETCFYRNGPQMQGFRGVVLPAVIEAKKRLRCNQLRIWSAGCSTGEEAYTLAMILHEEMQDRLRGWTVEVLGTDLNDRSLARAEAAAYDDYSLRSMPPDYSARFLRRTADGHFLVRDEIRSMVSFDRLNLLDSSRMVFMKGIDVIFCCNVLIYFCSETKRRTIQHFYNNLLPHGYLFLGHAESLFGVNDSFRMIPFSGGSAYRKGGRDAGTQPARVALSAQA